jgi:phosphoglycolate phosphatase
MPRDTVIFDLDGTLLDTLQDIADAGNQLLAHHDRPARPVDDYRYLAGQGVRSLVAEALPDLQGDPLDEAVAWYRRAYAALDDASAGPYPGIMDMLDALAERGATLAVLSNKPHDAMVRVIDRFLGAQRFAAVLGHQPPTPLKPDPTPGIKLLRELDVAADRCVYVGDTAADMQTGTALKLHIVGVTWGFRAEAELRQTGADVIIHEPRELLAQLVQ